MLVTSHIIAWFHAYSLCRGDLGVGYQHNFWSWIGEKRSSRENQRPRYQHSWWSQAGTIVGFFLVFAECFNADWFLYLFRFSFDVELHKPISHKLGDSPTPEKSSVESNIDEMLSLPVGHSDTSLQQSALPPVTKRSRKGGKAELVQQQNFVWLIKNWFHYFSECLPVILFFYFH